MMMVMTKADPQVPLSSRVAPVSFSKNHTTNQIIYVKVTTHHKIIRSLDQTTP